MRPLSRARCAAGLHSGEWTLPGTRCETVRICSSCGKREEQTQHVWSDFDYAAADQCAQSRRCERCGSTDSRTQHEWGPWLYLNGEFTSPQFHRCRRCHQTERTQYTLR
jgi:hypothetical protein